MPRIDARRPRQAATKSSSIDREVGWMREDQAKTKSLERANSGLAGMKSPESILQQSLHDAEVRFASGQGNGAYRRRKKVSIPPHEGARRLLPRGGRVWMPSSLPSNSSRPSNASRKKRSGRTRQSRDGILAPDLAGRAERKSRDELRGGLGHQGSLGDYAKDLEEHRKALQEGDISQKEFGEWQKDRRKRAVGKMAADQPRDPPRPPPWPPQPRAHALIAQAAHRRPQGENRRRRR